MTAAPCTYGIILHQATHKCIETHHQLTCNGNHEIAPRFPSAYLLNGYNCLTAHARTAKLCPVLIESCYSLQKKALLTRDLRDLPDLCLTLRPRDSNHISLSHSFSTSLPPVGVHTLSVRSRTEPSRRHCELIDLQQPTNVSSLSILHITPNATHCSFHATESSPYSTLQLPPCGIESQLTLLTPSIYLIIATPSM